MAEATNGMLDKSRSGRNGIQQQNEQDIVLRLLPMLNEGLAMKNVPDLRVGCYMLISIMAAKGGLDDKLLTAMMEAVVQGWTSETTLPALVCLCILAQHRGAKQITKRVTKELLKVPDITKYLIELAKSRRVDRLCNGLCLALVDRVVKHGDANGLPTIVAIIENQLLSEPQASVLIKSLLLAAYRVDATANAQIDIIPQLANSLVILTQFTGRIGFVVQKALEETDVDMDDLELRLHAKIRREALPLAGEDIPMADSPQVAISQNFSTRFGPLLDQKTTESSCLSHGQPSIYSDLCEAFVASTSSSSDLDIFDHSPILRRGSALEDALYLSFYMKTWCGPHPVLARVSALHMASRCIMTWKGSMVDVQAVIPYVIAALCDPAGKVRHAAAELAIQIEQLYPEDVAAKRPQQLRRWASEELYGDQSQEVKWLSKDNVIRLLREILLPTLEECVLDKKHIENVLQNSLSSPRATEPPKKAEVGRVPQTNRLAIFSFLASHTVHTPSLSVKLRLLTSLNHIQSIGSTTRTKVLLPVLLQWASLSPSEVTRQCQKEQLDFGILDDQSLLTVISSDKEGLQTLTHIVKGDIAADRPDLIKGVFKRLRVMWPSFKDEARLRTAQMLMESMDASLNGASHISLASDDSLEFLRTVPLSTDILLYFLSELPTATKMADNAPAAKRRRTSHGEIAAGPQDPKRISTAIKQVTFVLQLIDSSEPGKHPGLLKALFNTLAELQHLKAQVGSELAYIQGLLLGSLSEIMKAHKLDTSLKLDRSAIRTDLLVDCVQKTTSPQVQNAALLLISALADITPDLVLHSVMPIFTFMGSSLLRQSDDYSAFVIGQTIRDVIPPLVASLRKAKGNPVTGAAELLLSFVAAYEHVPSHRRSGLFKSLVQTLGAEDFLFALLAMLVDKYGVIDDMKSFAVELSGSFSVEIQLQSAVKSLSLVNDVLKPKPAFAGALLTTPDGDALDPQRVALNELELIQHLLSRKRLISQTGRLLSQDDMDAARIRDIYSNLLENVLSLADVLKEQKRLHSSCGDVLEKLLGLLSTTEFIKSIDGLLDRSNESLRRKILLSLEVRVDHERQSDAASRVAMLGFLPQLTAIVRDSKDALYKHTAVACIDKISEKYGKKDIEAVAAAAETIAGAHCLGQSDNRLRVMALLCLASLVDILQEGIVSVLPVAIPKALEYMESSIQGDSKDQKLHNAGYAFMSSLVQYVPYMISGAYLDTLLSISNVSAEADLDNDADESRTQCLYLAAKKIDAKTMFVALEKDWEPAFKAGTLVRTHDTRYLTLFTNLNRPFENTLRY